MKHQCHCRIYLSIEPNTSTIVAFCNFKTLSNDNLRLLSELPVKHCGKVRVSKFCSFELILVLLVIFSMKKRIKVCRKL